MLEAKWDKLVARYDTQYQNHLRVHKMVDKWLKPGHDVTVSDQTEVQKHLALCNSSLKSAQTLIANHAGFDSSGKVINRTIARKTIVQLGNALQLHAKSFIGLKVHTGG